METYSFMVIAILSIMVLSKSPETMANSVDWANTIGCHRILNHTHVIQEDKNGRTCSGMVRIWGCKGRCLSYAIADWNFPYKLSYHPVCVHEQRLEAVAILPNCEKGVAPGTNEYKYFEAGECKCSICNSSESSCEGAHKRGKPLHPAVQDGNMFMDDPVTPDEPENRKWAESIPQDLQPPVYP